MARGVGVAFWRERSCILIFGGHFSSPDCAASPSDSFSIHSGVCAVILTSLGEEGSISMSVGIVVPSCWCCLRMWGVGCPGGIESRSKMEYLLIVLGADLAVGCDACDLVVVRRDCCVFQADSLLVSDLSADFHVSPVLLQTRME